MSRSLRLLVAALTIAACTHQVDPSVSPKKLPPVTPPINARAMLIIAPSFENYTAEASSGMHHFRYHYGESAAKALSDLVTASFTTAEIRHLSDLDVLTALSGQADAARFDVLLVPAFERAGARERFFDVKAEVVLLMNARCLRTGQVFAWHTEGGTARVITSQEGLTGSALERALLGVKDSLVAHRAELEAAGPTPVAMP